LCTDTSIVPSRNSFIKHLFDSSFFFKIIKKVEMGYFRIIKIKKMRFHTRKWIKPEDLNPNGTLFGGQLLAWIDEELAFISSN
jgi:hypothetical protein